MKAKGEKLKILFDTNVVLDVLLDREPHVAASLELMSAVERGALQGLLCATTVTTIDYLTGRALDRHAAGRAIRSLLSLYDVAAVDRATLNLALDLGFEDFEDAVLYQSGLGAGVDGLVSRNQRDFRKASIPVYAPTELVALLRTGP